MNPKVIILIIIIIAAVIAPVLYFALKIYFNRQYLLRNGIATGAKVVTITATIAEVSNSTDLPKRVYSIDLGITASGKPYYILTFKRAFNSWERIPGEGDEMIILIDPKDPNNAMLAPYQNKSE